MQSFKVSLAVLLFIAGISAVTWPFSPFSDHDSHAAPFVLFGGLIMLCVATAVWAKYRQRDLPRVGRATGEPRG